MINRLKFIFGPAALVAVACKAQDDAPLPVCPICRSDGEMIDSFIYACKAVGCGVLFRNNKPEEQ